MNTNNPITEIILGVLSGLFIVGACVLLFYGKIDFTAASLMFGVPAALLGVNSAFKAASPAQQAQLQALSSQVISRLPAVVSATSSQPAAQPSAQAQFQAGNTFDMPVVPK